MVFSALPFLLGFLPLCLFGFWALRYGYYLQLAAINRSHGPPSRCSHWLAYLPLLWLLGASLWFYANWRSDHLLLLMTVILVNYLCARLLAKRRKRWILIAIISANLMLLAFFKYWPVFEGGASRAILLAGLPLGISFYIFQAVAFQVDHWRGKTQSNSLVEFALFLSFFPQLIAGPIVHGRQLLPQIEKLGQRLPLASLGFTMLTLGLAKKVLIADTLSGGVDGLYAGQFGENSLVTVTAAVGYGTQLYFDFSGYADMAVGLALLFGIRLPQNFRRPYAASSMRTFWRRWHITLSTFLKEYLYIPLGGNRRGQMRRSLNLILTMGLGGLWHGAGWQFLVWGLGHGACLTVEQWCRQTCPRLTALFPKAVSIALTFSVVMALWIPFRAQSLTHATSMYLGLLTLPEEIWPAGTSLPQAWATLSTAGAPPVVTLAVASLALMVCAVRPTAWRWSLKASRLQRGFCSAFLLLLVLKALSDRPEQPFLYFQF